MNEPGHRFVWYLCKMYRKSPVDSFIVDMDPVLKMWHYWHWIGDQRDDAELAKNHAYLLGSFWNAEAVQKMLNDNVHESSDEDFETSQQMVLDSLSLPVPDKLPPKKRKRKSKLKNQPQK
jgi:hypothetical protein